MLILIRLTIKDFKFIKLPAGLEVFNSEGNVVAWLHLHDPGAGLEVGEATTWRLTQNHSCRCCQHLIHWTHNWEDKRKKV